MANAIVILIILAAAGYHFQKGGVIKSFGMVIVTIAACIITFGYFEMLTNLLLSKVPERFFFIVPWLHPLCFVLLFALSFAILQTILNQLLRQKINFEKNTEHIVRITCGALIGFLFSGLLLTALAMAPISTKFPYQRFDKNRPEPQNPKRPLLNPDGFVAGLFSQISSGSLSSIRNKTSFATVHPDYLSQLHLNRQGLSDKIPLISLGNEIVTPTKNAAWFAPEILKDSKGNAITPKTGYNLLIVRAGIKKLHIRMKSDFTPSQLRLICKPKSSKKLHKGKATSIYPLGYLITSEMMKKTKLTDHIELTREDLTENLTNGIGKWIDFVFEVPEKLTPIAIEFRQNSIARISEPVSPENAPAASIFIPASKCAKDYAELEPVTSAQIYGLSMTAQFKLLQDLTLEVENEDQFTQYQTENTIEPPQYDDNKIRFVRAELKTSNRKEKRAQDYSYSRSLEGFPAMLKPLEGYNLIAVKCNNPGVGSETTADQLPVLKELTGRIHKAVGVIACGKLESDFIYEIDFCSVTSDQSSDGLIIAEDGSVSKPFPESIWITEKVEEILEFYVIYMVKPGPDVIITSVKPAQSQAEGTFKMFEGFIVK